MVQIVASAELREILKNTDAAVEFIDGNGKRLGTLVRPPSEEDIEIAKQRLSDDRPKYTTHEVVAHLRSLEES